MSLMIPLRPRELYKLPPTDGLYREPCNVRCTVPESCLFYGVMLRGEWRLHGIYLTTLGPPVPGGLTVSERPLVECCIETIASRFDMPPGQRTIVLSPGDELRLDISDPYPELERTMYACFIC